MCLYKLCFGNRSHTSVAETNGTSVTAELPYVIRRNIFCRPAKLRLSRIFLMLIVIATLYGCAGTPKTEVGDSASRLEYIYSTDVSATDEPNPSAKVSFEKDSSGNQIDDRISSALSSYQKVLADENLSADRRQYALRRLGQLSSVASEVEALDNGTNEAEQGTVPEDQQGTRSSESISSTDQTPNGYYQAIGAYRDYLKEFPDAEGNDEVLYMLAQAYRESGQPAQAIKALERLVRNHPESPLATESWFRLGETYFLKRDYPNALNAYQKVVNNGKDSRFYDQALYKLGWTQFKLDRFDKAIDTFIQTVDLKSDSTRSVNLDQLPPADVEFVNDAFRGLSITVSYLDGPRTLRSVFDEHPDRNYKAVAFEKLGDFYLNENRYSDAAQSYTVFANEFNTHPRAPILMDKAITAYRQGGFRNQAIKTTEQLVDYFALQTDFWEKNSKADVPKAVDIVSDHLLELGKRAHARFQDTGSAEDRTEAIRYYTTYLDLFRDIKPTGIANLMIGDLLYDAGQFIEAAERYEKAAYESEEEFKRSAEAGYAALQAYTEAIDSVRRENGNGQGDRFVSLVDSQAESTRQFATTFPDHPKRNEVLLSTADQLLDANNWPPASDLAQLVLASENRDELSGDLERKAYSILGIAYFEQGLYQDSESAYEKLVSMTPRDDPSYSGYRDRLAAAIYKQGEIASKQDDPEEAAKQFARVNEVTPEGRIAATASFDAAVTYIKTEQWDQAIDELNRFRERFPEDERRQEATRRLAVAYLEVGQDEQAADEFRRLADRAADTTVQRESLLQAADLYRETNKPQEAIESLNTYVKRFSSPVEAIVEARNQLAQLYEDAGETSDQYEQLRRITAIASPDNKDLTSRTRFVAAQAAIQIADRVEEPFKAVTIEAPLEETVEQKKDRLQNALEHYSTAAKYGIADITTKATFKIGQLYYHFKEALLDSERPDDLSDLELEEYNILLEDLAFPFEDNARQAYERNAFRVSEGIYNEWVKQSIQKLRELMPVRYDKDEKATNAVARL